MSIFVKICGLKEERHVNAAIDAGADALGFVFAKSRRKITPADASSISMNVPAHILRVAVMLHPTNEEWQKVLSGFSPDVLQADAQYFASLDVPHSVEKWPVFREDGEGPATDDTYIFEGKKSGHGETVDWSRAATIAKNGRMILAGGLFAGNVAEAIATVHPLGVDVSSGVESAPGQKDIQLIKKFISAAKAAEKSL